jgi:hypothetical protein
MPGWQTHSVRLLAAEDLRVVFEYSLGIMVSGPAIKAAMKPEPRIIVLIRIVFGGAEA